MTVSWPPRRPFWTLVSYAVVALAAAGLVVSLDAARERRDQTSISVDRLASQMLVESDDEHAALQLILSGNPNDVKRGRRMLEDAALEGRPTAQRHLATYWALTDDTDRRARVYQWLVIALACARGFDLEDGNDTQINYLLFLSNIAQIEKTTTEGDKDMGRAWAKGWFEANSGVSGLRTCDVATIDGYRNE